MFLYIGLFIISNSFLVYSCEDITDDFSITNYFNNLEEALSFKKNNYQNLNSNHRDKSHNIQITIVPKNHIPLPGIDATLCYKTFFLCNDADVIQNSRTNNLHRISTNKNLKIDSEITPAVESIDEKKNKSKKRSLIITPETVTQNVEKKRKLKSDTSDEKKTVLQNNVIDPKKKLCQLLALKENTRVVDIKYKALQNINLIFYSEIESQIRDTLLEKIRQNYLNIQANNWAENPIAKIDCYIKELLKIEPLAKTNIIYQTLLNLLEKSIEIST